MWTDVHPCVREPQTPRMTYAVVHTSGVPAHTHRGHADQSVNDAVLCASGREDGAAVSGSGGTAALVLRGGDTGRHAPLGVRTPYVGCVRAPSFRSSRVQTFTAV